MPSRLFQVLLERQYLQRVLLENRLDFLKKKYVPLLNQHMVKLETNGGGLDYNELVTTVGNALQIHDAITPENVFDWIVSLDPEPSKKFTQWLLNTFLKEVWIPEDGYKAKEMLELFEKVKHLLPVEQRDINKYKTLQELYSVIQPHRTTISKKEIEKLHSEEMHGQARVVYNNSKYKIVVPLTQEAACHFGVNTQWCTAAKHSDNQFDNYNERGDLYIIIDKANNKRWQFHFETEQLMDENDRSIDVDQFTQAHPQIAEFFKYIDEQSEVKLPEVIEYSNQDFDLGVVEQYRIFRTEKGYTIKTAPGLNGKPIGNFKVSPEHYLMGGHWDYAGEDKIIVKILNYLGILGGTVKVAPAFAENVYYDEPTEKWGTFGQLSEFVANIKGSLTWKALDVEIVHNEYKANVLRQLSNAVTKFVICKDDDEYVDGNGTILYHAFVDDTHTFSYWFLHSNTDLDTVLMPLIKARKDILYWKSDEYHNFRALNTDSRKWLFENRPTLCEPQYTFTRFGPTKEVKDTILHILKSSNLGSLGGDVASRVKPVYWMGDYLVGKVWTDGKFMLEDMLGYKKLANSERDKKLKQIKWLYYLNKDAWQSTDTIDAYKKGYKKDATYYILVPIADVIKVLSSPTFANKGQYWWQLAKNFNSSNI